MDKQPQLVAISSFNISLWPITSTELNNYTQFLNVEDQMKVHSYSEFKDKLLCLVSRLLLYKLLYELVKDIKIWQHIKLDKDRYGKPYLNKDFIQKFPILNNLEFNLSHHGNFVILVSGYNMRLGVDVMQVSLPTQEPNFESFVKDYKNEFSLEEWNSIHKVKDSKEYIKLNRFMELWCLKEALIKANGKGLSIPLNQMTFHLNNKPEVVNFDIWTNTTYTISNGEDLYGFHFYEVYLDSIHCLCIAINHKFEIKEVNLILPFELINLIK